MMRKIKTKKAGITLVGLVVTIIVLLILAGITINLTIGEEGIIRKAQEAGKNYIQAAENEKLLLGQFTNEMNNSISGSGDNGREPYNSEFRKNVVEAIKNAGVVTTESDTDETIVANIGKILQESTKSATATADDITAGKTAYVNGSKITGTLESNNSSITMHLGPFGMGKEVGVTNGDFVNLNNLNKYSSCKITYGGNMGTYISARVYLDGTLIKTISDTSTHTITFNNNSNMIINFYSYNNLVRGSATVAIELN